MPTEVTPVIKPLTAVVALKGRRFSFEGGVSPLQVLLEILVQGEPLVALRAGEGFHGGMSCHVISKIDILMELFTALVALVRFFAVVIKQVNRQTGFPFESFAAKFAFEFLFERRFRVCTFPLFVGCQMCFEGIFLSEPLRTKLAEERFFPRVGENVVIQSRFPLESLLTYRTLERFFRLVNYLVIDEKNF